jgi:hypothetical protein
MSYRIYISGIVCLVYDGGGYIVSLPNGLKVDNPRHPGTPIDRHAPTLIVVPKDVKNMSVWPGAEARNGIFFLPIDEGALVTFQYANTPQDLDASDFAANAYKWDDIDSKFLISKRPPQYSIANAEIRHGIMRSVRMPRGEATIVEAEIPTPSTATSIEIKSATTARTLSVSLAPQSDVVLANVSVEFMNDPNTPTSDDDHIFIYYVLDENPHPPDLTLRLQPKKLPAAITQHPFLKDGRDLNVHCSPIKYP